MKNPKKLTTKEMRALPYDELRMYLDSIYPKKTFLPLPPIDYNSMTFDEAVIKAGELCNMFANKMDQDPISLILKRYKEKRPAKEKFQFFCSSLSPFSQYYKVDFKAPIFSKGHFILEWQKTHTGSSEIEFSSAEKYIMLRKSIMFGDHLILKEIMKTDSIRKINELGRKVCNFDEDVWGFHRIGVVYYANFYKFKNNAELRNTLLETSPKTLVAATPNDKIWGIGLSESDKRANDRETWLGFNLLGEILTNLREDFISGKWDLN